MLILENYYVDLSKVNYAYYQVLETFDSSKGVAVIGRESKYVVIKFMNNDLLHLPVSNEGDAKIILKEINEGK